MKKIVYLTILLIAFYGSALYAQSFAWARKMGGAGEDHGKAIVIDKFGNIYVAGYFNQTADLDPGVAVNSHTSKGASDAFVIKTDNSGNLLWAKTFGGSGIDYGNALAVDNDGNVYITGEFRDTVDFDPGPATFQTIAAGASDVYVVKLNASGNFVWAKKMSGIASEYSHTINTDAAGNVFIAGYFEDTVDFDPGAGNFLLTAASQDIYITKLDPSGNFLWTKQMGGPSVDVAFCIAIDNAGNVYATGSFEQTADFDPGAGTFNLVSAAYTDMFITKLDPSGNFIWAKQIGGAGTEHGSCLALDTQNNLYITGAFNDTVDFDPGPATFNLYGNEGIIDDIFVLKLNAAGIFVWAKRIGGENEDSGSSLVIDTDNNVYVTGSFQDTVDFDPGVPAFPLLGYNEYSDIFVTRLDPSGNFRWAMQMGGKGIDAGYGIALDGNCNIFTTGSFAGPNPYSDDLGDFDPGTATYTLMSAGMNDIFISRLNPCTTPNMLISTSSPTVCVGQSVTFTASGSSSCVWNTGATGSMLTVTPGITTTYTVSGPDGSGCVNRASITVTVDACTALQEETTSKIQVTVFPNPNTGKFTVNVPNAEIQNIQVFNSLGSLVNRTLIKNQVDLGNEPEGVYMLSIKTSKGTMHIRVIKE